MQLKSGSRLQSGKYRIIRVLGQGGFGITYLAENILFERNVAIKEFFPKDFCGRDNTSHLTLGTQNNAETVARLRDRFIKEAKNIAKLDHPGIVKIHDIFEENSTAYYVMNYIEGENLNEMVKRNGPLSESTAIKYIRKVGDALDYIHSRNMTHFDVKPANIVVRQKDDQPILIDFGLSKQYDMNGDATSTLMQGVSQGYSPIELYNAGSITSFSPQTDVYSLAATLFYLVTGTIPPQASSILNDGLTLPYGLSSAVVLAINSGMTIRKKDRPSSVYSWLETLPSNLSSGFPSAPSHQDASAHSSTTNPGNDNEETTLFTDTTSSSSHTSSNIFDKQNSTKEPKRDSYEKIIPICLTIIGFFTLILICVFLYVALKNTNSLPTSDYTTETELVAIESNRPHSVKDMKFTTTIGGGTYTGEVDESGLPHGKGEITFIKSELNDNYKSAKTYNGEWSHGNMHGQCTYTLQPSISGPVDIFTGTFSNNQYSNGKYVNGTDGSYYKGTFKNGLPYNGWLFKKNGNAIRYIENGK